MYDRDYERKLNPEGRNEGRTEWWKGVTLYAPAILWPGHKKMCLSNMNASSKFKWTIFSIKVTVQVTGSLKAFHYLSMKSLSLSGSPKDFCNRHTHRQIHRQTRQQGTQWATYSAPEYNVPLFDGLAWVAILFFGSPNLVEDIKILLPVKFRWIPFSGFRGEVKHVLANQRQRPPSCFCDPPEKHKLCRGRWNLTSCQVSLNSIQQFQMRSPKCLSQSEASAAILSFWLAWETQTW